MIGFDKVTGLPTIEPEKAKKGARKAVIMNFMMPVVLTLIGFGIASAIHSLGSTDLYEQRIDIVL